MQLLKKINLIVLIINIVLSIIMSIAYFLSVGMAPILGVIFAIATFFNIVLLSWLYKLNFQKVDLVGTSEKIQFGVIILLSIVLISFSLRWVFELPEVIQTAKDYQANKSKLENFNRGEAPIENGVWKYKYWDGRTFTIPCENGKINGRAIIEEESGFVTNEFYNQGRLDSIIVYTDFAIFEKEYFVEKTKTRIRYEYSDNYETLIDSDTMVTLLD